MKGVVDPMSTASELQHRIADLEAQVSDRDNTIKKSKSRENNLMKVIKRSRDSEEKLRQKIAELESRKNDVADEYLAAREAKSKAEQDAKRIRNEARKVGKDTAVKVVSDAKKRASDIIDRANKQKKNIIDSANEQKKAIIDKANKSAQKLANDVRDEAASTLLVAQRHAAQMLNTARKNANVMNKSSEDARRQTQALLSKLKKTADKLQDFVDDPTWEQLNKPIEVDPLLAETADAYADEDAAQEKRLSEARKQQKQDEQSVKDDAMMNALKGEIDQQTAEYKNNNSDTDDDDTTDIDDDSHTASTDYDDSEPEPSDDEYLGELNDVIGDTISKSRN